MGYAEKKNQEVRAAGQYNVHVKVEYINGSSVEFDAKRWIHNGDSLACDLFTGKFCVIQLFQAKYFEISNLTDKKPSLM